MANTRVTALACKDEELGLELLDSAQTDGGAYLIAEGVWLLASCEFAAMDGALVCDLRLRTFEAA